jgi:hypothetical protein
LGWTVALGAVLTVTIAPTALGAAVPVSPPPDAVTSSHPTFAWTLGRFDSTQAVYVARKPDVTPEGRFHNENVVATGFIAQGSTTSWAPSEALFSGRHWWTVETRDDNFVASFSSPSPFTVRPEVRVLAVRFSRFTFSNQLRIDVRWVTNAKQVIVEARFLRAGRLVGRVREPHETIVSRDPDRGFLTWKMRARVKEGTRLTALIRVTGGGRTATLPRTVLAP